jgi:hypothetical protein
MCRHECRYPVPESQMPDHRVVLVDHNREPSRIRDMSNHSGYKCPKLAGTRLHVHEPSLAA